MPPAVRTVPEEELAVGAGLVIGLGGDGTILRALKLATEHEVPVLGVNLGRLAFLAEVNLDELPGRAGPDRPRASTGSRSAR